MSVRWLKKALGNAVTLLSCLSVAAQPILAEGIQGGGPKAPQVVTTANGLPMVMIVTPDANGVSHNTFSSFGVGPNGAILNNADQNYVNTQLAGWVQGNSNLKDGAAGLIIGEVVSNTPSTLQGYLEVAGASADLIIANPYGITCNGCGFLNTDHAALTTGKPKYIDGAFKELGVDQGAITIGRGGLDARGVSQFDLIARKVVFDGAVIGERVRVIAGRNDVIFATGATKSRAADGSTAPAYGIDSSVFGGMYAGKITLNSTEQGVGVRAPQKMAAGTGGMTLTAEGRLVIGQATTTGTARLKARDVQVQKSLHAQQALSVEARRNIVLDADASIVARAAMSLTAEGGITLNDRAILHANSASLQAAAQFQMAAGAQALSWGDMTISAATGALGQGAKLIAGVEVDGKPDHISDLKLTFSDNVSAQSAQVFASGALSFEADEVTIDANPALPASQFVGQTSVEIEGRNLSLGKSAIVSGAGLKLTASGLLSTATGAVIAATDALGISAEELRLTGAKLTANHDIRVSSPGHVESAETEIIAGQGASVSAQILTLTDGALYALDGDLQLQTSGDLTSSAGVFATGALTMAAGGALATSGDGLADMGADVASITLTGASVSQTGDILVLGDTTLEASAGDVTLGGELVTAAALSITTPGKLSNSGLVQASGDIGLSAATLANTGRFATEANLIVDSGDITQTATGVMLANEDITLDATGALSLDGKTLAAGGDLILTASGLLSTEMGAVIAASEALQITAEELRLIGAVLNANLDIELVASGSAEITGTDIIAGQGAFVTAEDLTIADGALYALDGDLQLRTTGDLINSASVFATGVLSMTAGGALATSGDGLANAGADVATLTLTGSSVSQTGDLLVLGDTTFEATAGDVTLGGELITAAGLAITATDTITNVGLTQASGDITLMAAALANGGSLASEANLIVNSGDITQAASGVMLANEDITLDVSGTLSLDGKTLAAGGDLMLTATEIALLGEVKAANQLMATATNHLATSGDVRSNAPLRLSAGSMALDGIVSARDGIDITSTTGDISILGEVATNGALALTSAHNLAMGSTATLASVENGLTITAAGRLQTDGTVFGQTGATLSGDSLDLRGSVQTGGRLDLRAQSGGFVNLADVVAGFIDAQSGAAMQLGGSLTGPIVATATGALTVSGDIDVVRPTDVDPSFVTGAYLTGASVNITSGAKLTSDQLVVLEATTGNVKNAGIVTAGSSAQITAAGAVTNAGQLLADEVLVINAGSLSATATGKGQADQIALSIGGDVINAGAFRAQTLLDASIGGRLTNSGRIETAAGNTQISAGSLRNSGQIKSHDGTTFLTDLTGFNNAGGTIFGENGVVLETLSRLTLGAGVWGDVVSENTVSLTGKDGGYLPGLTVNAGAELVNEGKLIIKSTSINNSGTIASATDTVTLLTQGNLTNRGLIYAGGAALVIGAAGNVYNRSGSILANHDLLIAGLPDAAGSFVGSNGKYLRAGSIQNLSGGVIETFNGDIALAADTILNKRTVTIQDNGVTYDNGYGNTSWTLCMSPTNCLPRKSGGFITTIAPGSDYQNDISPFNWQLGLKVSEVTASGIGPASAIVSGGGIVIQGGSVRNEYALISATDNIHFDAGSIVNVGARPGREIIWSTSFIAGSDSTTGGSYSSDSRALYSFQKAFGLVGIFYDPSATYSDFTPQGGALGKFLPGETLNDSGQSAKVLIRLDTETGILTQQGEFLRFADMPGFTPDPSSKVHGWLEGRFSTHGTVAGWGRFSTEKMFLPQGDVFGTIEAGGSINGTVTGTVSNWALGANKSNLFGTGNIRPDVDPRLPGGPAAKLTLAAANGQAITSLNRLSSTALNGLSASNLVLHPLDPNSISGWGTGEAVIGGAVHAGAVDRGFTDLIGEIDFGSFGNTQLFKLNPPTLGGYLVETRHEFIDRNSFISSDYFLKSLNYDPAKTQTRFGDALAETYLIRDQIYDLTGRRLLPGAKTEKDQIRAMYGNAVDASKSLGLTVGTALSPQQISRLTEDIVWLEERVVSGHKVLVPQVYLAGSAGLIRKTPGATITAQDISLQVGDLTNLGGAFQTSGDLVIAAASDISNQFGEMIAGGALSLGSELGQVSLQSGLLSGGSVGIRANEILIETVSERFGTPDNHHTDIGRIASIRSGGVLSLIGAGDISVSGASLVATDDLLIFAGGDIDIGSVLNSSALSVGDQKNGLNIARRTHINSLLQSKDGSVSIVSAQTGERDGATHLTGGGDITLSGTTVLAEDAVDIAALAGNVTLSAVLDTDYFETHSFKQYGLFGINKKQTHTEKLSATWTGNTIEAGQVSISAAGNVVDQASTLLANEGDLDLTAQSGSVHSLSVTDIDASKTIEHKSTLWGLMDWSTEVNSLKATAQSIEASAAKDLKLTAGQDIVIEGGRLTGENVIFDAQNVALIATVDTDYTETITHSNFGVIVVDTHQVDAVQTAGFTEINGKADFGDAPVYVDLQQTQAALIHAIPALLAPEGEDAVRMALVDHYLPEANGPPAAGGDPIAAAIQAAFTPKPGGSDDADGDDSDEPGPNDFSNSTFSVTVPGALDGAGFAYLDQLFAADQLTVAEMELVNHHFYDRTTQLGVVGHLLLAFAMPHILGANGLGLLHVAAEGATLSAVQLAQNAIITSLSKSVMTGVITGEFDLEATLTSAFTAGLGAGLTAGFSLSDIVGLDPEGSLGFLTAGGEFNSFNLVETFGDTIINAGITSAVTGDDFFDTFLTSFASGVVSLATADLQELIGDEFAGGANGGEGSLGHALTHAGLGCIAAELQGSTCAAGAASGAASALFAGYIKGNSELDGNDFIDEAHLIAGLAAALTGADTTATLTAAGIGQSAFVNNYLNHEEASRRASIINELDNCLDNTNACSESEINSLRDELVALNKLDADRDAALAAACGAGASSTGCQAELTKLQDAFESYSGVISSRDVFRDGTLGEALEVAGQFGDLSSQAMSETARAALIEMPVDTVKGLIDLASIAAGALTGDEQSILQMGMIADHLQALVTDPVGTIETQIAAELARADVLEAQGNLEEANKIRSKVFISGALAVSGVPGAVSATSAGIKVAVKSGGSLKVGEFIVREDGSLKLLGGGATNKGLDGFYEPRAWRQNYEDFYSGNVSSTTVPPYSAKNVHMAGKRHPETDIVYDQRGFPIFDDVARYDTRFPADQFGATDYQGQMRMATRDLREQLSNNSQLRSQFEPDQLQAIQSGRANIPRLTWHHHQDSGRMQLVPRDLHADTGHIGGASMSAGQ